VTVQSDSHDIVLIGASAGGVEALRSLVSRFPQGLRASVFIVLHLLPDLPSGLAPILDRAGPLPATQVSEREPIRHGHIYVAPPNLHLVVRPGYVALDAGPRENRSRPAVDVLFRSAARSYKQRVIGMVLSGTLSDGALGLAAIKLRGGLTMVQDPEEALFSGMPRHALSTAPINYCLRIDDLADRLVDLTTHSSLRDPMDNNTFDSSEPTEHAADEPAEEVSPKRANAASGLTCPECHGSLWELKSDGGTRFECRVGHAYSPEALMPEQGEAVEAALWSAINHLQERAATFRRLSADAPTAAPRRGYDERAQQTEQQAEVLHDLLRRLVVDEIIG
jgi:two-component system, chemotaxis family, protein-glutamate methylesterase/glutaminase